MQPGRFGKNAYAGAVDIKTTTPIPSLTNIVTQLALSIMLAKPHLLYLILLALLLCNTNTQTVILRVLNGYEQDALIDENNTALLSQNDYSIANLRLGYAQKNYSVYAFSGKFLIVSLLCR